jgi:hypothetical protein
MHYPTRYSSTHPSDRPLSVYIPSTLIYRVDLFTHPCSCLINFLKNFNSNLRITNMPDIQLLTARDGVKNGESSRSWNIQVSPSIVSLFLYYYERS